MSKQTKFTLGKLFVNEGQPVTSVMCGDKGDPEIVAMLETNDPMMVANRNEGVDYDLLETYAKLFAAAPDLYAACEGLLKFNEELCRDVNVSTNYPSATKARQALAKARGEQ